MLQAEIVFFKNQKLKHLFIDMILQRKFTDIFKHFFKKRIALLLQFKKYCKRLVGYFLIINCYAAASLNS